MKKTKEEMLVKVAQLQREINDAEDKLKEYEGYCDRCRIERLVVVGYLYNGSADTACPGCDQEDFTFSLR